MKQLLQKLSQAAIDLADVSYRQSCIGTKWLGDEGVTPDQLAEVEQRLEVKLPDDYKAFLTLTNGFAPALSTEPSFSPIDAVTYLRDEDTDVIQAYSVEGIQDVGEALSRAIIVGGVGEEQYFLLIPPDEDNLEWRYWKFAHWIPGEEEYPSLQAYFEEILTFVNEELAEE